MHNPQIHSPQMHSPEGLEPEPLAAEEIAGEQLATLRQFTYDLAIRGEELGLIGPKELERLWTRHILNSAIVAPLLNPGTTVADVGSGGGLPGLVLAIIRPDVSFSLIEPMERRCSWLNEQVERLGLKNTRVMRGRAEEFHAEVSVDVVTARAVSALKKLIPMTTPLLKNSGELILLKGAGVDAEISAAAQVIRKFKLQNARSEILGTGLINETTRVFRATVERA